MKLLIVEDEIYVRERLAEGIDWAAGQIDLVDAVSNGKEAVAILQNDHVDIIITDIQMPDMNGLELAGRVREAYPHIKVIILTGYDDFEYAREGIEHGVFKFLVKPVANEQLWEVVQGAKAVREDELREKHKLWMLEQRWQDHLPHLHDVFYKNWINGRYSLWELNKWSQALHLPIDGKSPWPIVVDMDPIPEESERFRVGDRPLVQFALFTVARDLFASRDCVIIQDDDGMTALIFLMPPQEPEEAYQAHVLHQINVLLSTIKDCLKLTASAGIGSPVADKLHLPHAYKQSRMALQERVVLGHEMIIHYRDDAVMKDTWSFLSDLEKELEMSIETGDEEAIKEKVERMMEAGFAEGMPVEDAKETLLRIMCLLARIVHSHGWALRETLGEEYEDFEQFNQLLTREQIHAWLQRMTLRISSAIISRRQSCTQIAVGEMMRFIQERLHDDQLSLYLVADKLYVNYSYLSRMFKKVTGESFSDYVLRLRMEKAKELLAQGGRVSLTAERVGYRHVNYFSKAFAKYWGIKPSEVYKPHMPNK
ncbi:response regulator [Paenibacillus chungangensis]|uniref:Response regulator n=1 Tax=Paenibacillus chungangensis TaxID=696535 RepID=A0ABW3HLK5_9BACL